MEVKRITEVDEIRPLVEELGGNEQLVLDVISEFNQAAATACVLYVRYEKGWLQRQLVDLHHLDKPYFEAWLQHEKMWRF